MIDVFRFKKTIKNLNGESVTIPTKTVKITFRGQFLPDKVEFFYSKRKIKPFVPAVQKYCKQANQNCRNCGTPHSDECKNQTKCFHCKSPDHDAMDVICPEYARNVLIKEVMVYRNISYFEANDEYPRVQSKFNMQQRRDDFPTLSGRQSSYAQVTKEIQPSYPRKSENELKLQYSDYVRKQTGTGNESSSVKETTGQRDQGDKNNSTQVKKSKTTSNSRNPDEIKIDGIMNERKQEFIDEAFQILLWTFMQLQNVEKGPGTLVSNDLLLISISERLHDLFKDRQEIIGQMNIFSDSPQDDETHQ